MTATVRLPIGEIRDVAEAMQMFRGIVDEVRGVAAAEGADIGADAVRRHESFATSGQRVVLLNPSRAVRRLLELIESLGEEAWLIQEG